MEDLETFIGRARTWLDATVPPLPPSQELVWGEGSESVAVFKNLAAAEERTHVERYRAWQGTKTDAGYGSIAWPERYGGAGLTPAHDAAFAQLERLYDTPESHEAVGISLEMVGPTILTFGTEAQKDRYLGPLRRADEMWCQLFSEPGAGSDLGSVATHAARQADRWTINGQKVWTSGAQFADYGYLLARDDRSGSNRAGFTAFLVPMETQGIDVRPLRQMSGGSSFNEVFFNDVEVPDSCRLGEVGHGWNVMLTTLGYERMSSARGGSSMGVGLAERLCRLARNLGRADEPVVRQALARVHTDAQIRSWTMHRVDASLQSGTVPGPEGSIGKLAITNGLRQCAETAALLLGPAIAADTGRWGTYAWHELLCGAPGLRIAGGSDEIQRNIIGERILGLPREPR